MSEPVYFYETHMNWETRRRGTLSGERLPDLTVSTPPEFKGEAGFWTPEHLFVAAAESCLMATFLGISENSGLRVASYSSTAVGRLERVEEGGLRFTAILLRPVVELESAEDREKAVRVMTKAHKGCLVARSMAVRIDVLPEFVVRMPVAA